MTAIRILFGAAFVLAVCLACGELLFRALSIRLRPGERTFLAFITGAALFSNVVFLLAASHVFYTWILAAAGLAILSARWFFFPAPAQPEPDEGIRLPRIWHVIFWTPYIIFGTVYVVAAMSPEMSPDGGGGYHLGLVARYYDHRGFVPVPTNMYSGLPAGIEMLFLAAFAFGRHSAAALTHLLFLLLLPFGIIACCRRAGMERAGIIAALLFFLAPVVGKDATCAYVDVATAAIAFGAFSFFEIWREEGQRGALVPMALLAGFCYACKVTAGIAPVCAVAAVLACGIARHVPARTLWREAAIICVVALAPALPWLIRDLAVFGDPVFPFLNKLFPNPWQYPQIEAMWRQEMKHMNEVAFRQIPFEITVGGRLVGIIGPVFLLSPLALLGLLAVRGAESRFVRRVLVAFLLFGVTYFSNIGARFLIPALPFLSIAVAAGLLAAPRVGPALATFVLVAHAVLSWPFWIHRWSPRFQWGIDRPDLSAALRITPESQFLTNHWPDYQGGLLLDRFVPAGDLVYAPDMGQFAYHHRNIVGTFESSLARRVDLLAQTPVNTALARVWKHDLRIPLTPIRRLRLVTDTKRDVDFRVSEIRFYGPRGEIPRTANWKLSVSSNPWEIQRAFDGALLSWWTSGEYVEPGMWIETDFGDAVPIDRIVIEQNADQQPIAVHPAMWLGQSGQWRALPFKSRGKNLPAPDDLRMQVRDELKQMGIGWILVRNGYWEAAAFRDDAPYWGITEIAEGGDFQLWRLD